MLKKVLESTLKCVSKFEVSVKRNRIKLLATAYSVINFAVSIFSVDSLSPNNESTSMPFTECIR